MEVGGVHAITIMMHSNSLCMQMAVQFAGAHGASLQNMVAVGVCANTVMMHGGSLYMQMAVQCAGALYAVQTHIIENFYNSLVQFQGGVSLEVLSGFTSGAAFCSSAPRGAPLLCSTRGCQSGGRGLLLVAGGWGSGCLWR